VGPVTKQVVKGANLVIIHLLAYEDGTECSETSAYKIQTPGKYPEENIQHTEQRRKYEVKNDSRLSTNCAFQKCV